MATLEQTIEALTLLSAQFPHRQQSTVDWERMFEAYHAVLSDLDPSLLQAATLKVGAESEWFPSASQLRTAALDIVQEADELPGAAEAWAEIHQEIRRVGSWGQPQFAHRIVQQSVDALGGWQALCESDSAMADRAHFLRIYASLLTRDRTDRVQLPAVADYIAQLAAAKSVEPKSIPGPEPEE